MSKFSPDWRVAPGETIEELIHDANLSLGRVARELGMTRGDFDLFLSGALPLTKRRAHDLEKIFSVSREFWLKLEELYRA